MITISVTGTKLEAAEQLEQQTDDPVIKRALLAIIDKAPGTMVSLTGSMSSDKARKFGRINIAGSFWTG